MEHAPCRQADHHRGELLAGGGRIRGTRCYDRSAQRGGRALCCREGRAFPNRLRREPVPGVEAQDYPYVKSCHIVPSLEARHGGPSKSVLGLATALARGGQEVE